MNRFIVMEFAHVPTPDEVRALRDRLGLSQSQMVARLAPGAIALANWQRYEQGARKMAPAVWRYVLAQVGELTLPE